ncbi:MAG: HD domain-containing protein, partial [Pseudoxanthomonas sp.]
MSFAPLQTWLASRSADGLAPDMRAAIADAAQPSNLETGMPDAWPVLADTLDALAGLSAESDVLVAALLFGIPGLQAGLKAQLARQPGIAGLLEGQNAAAQVWALHAERTIAGNSEGLRRLLLSIVHDLRV